MRIWEVRNLTLARKFVAFKTIAISKIVFPKHIISETEKIQKPSLKKNSIPKIKHETLNDNNYLQNILRIY